MSNLLKKAMAFGICAAFALPVFAQGEAQEKSIATLQVDKGVVMTSRGGEYATGKTGQQLFEKERLMVTQDGTATVIYSDHCRQTYDKPGVYELDANCKVVAWWGGGGVAVAVAAGVLIHNLNDSGQHHPISR